VDQKKLELWMDALRDVLANGPEPRFPAEPPVGTVLRYRHIFDNKTGPKPYDYLAFRTETGWRVTGRENNTLTWEVLQDRIGDNDCCMVVEYEDIPHRKPNPLDEIDNPRDWIAAVFSDKTGRNLSETEEDK